MKKRYIIGGIAAVLFIVLAALSFNKSSIDYANFSQARNDGRRVQIIGTWVKSQPSEYLAAQNLFYFYLQDKNNETMKVVYNGGRPNNFTIASHFVIKGKVEGNEFHADEIFTKCPSKYEGNIEQLKKQQQQNTQNM